MKEGEQSLFLLFGDVGVKEEFLFSRTTFLGFGRDLLGFNIFDVRAIDEGFDEVDRVNAFGDGDRDISVVVVMVCARLVMIV